MARLPRLGIPSIPQHVIQRGNNRQACFYAEDDHRFYLECLGEAARKYRVSIHAYVLMTHHVHGLMTRLGRLLGKMGGWRKIRGVR
jgi:putative transposase